MKRYKLRDFYQIYVQAVQTNLEKPNGLLSATLRKHLRFATLQGSTGFLMLLSIQGYRKTSFVKKTVSQTLCDQRGNCELKHNWFTQLNASKQNYSILFLIVLLRTNKVSQILHFNSSFSKFTKNEIRVRQARKGYCESRFIISWYR